MTVTAIKPQTLARETFETFAIMDGPLSGPGTLRPLDEAGHDDLDEAVEFAACHVTHKGKFMVRHTNVPTGAVMLRFYVVRQKSKAVHRYHEFQTRAVRDTYAEWLFDLDQGAL